MERPTLRQLEYVAAVAEHGNFGRAAEACAVSQPALSSQIQELERRLGLVLFERGRHGATVTPEGAPVVARALRILVEVDDLVLEASDRAGEVIGEVRLGSIPTMAPYLLPVVVPELRRRHPRASVVLREERTPDLLVSLRAGTLDLALLAAPVDHPDLEVVDLATDPFLLAVAPGHPFAGRRAVPVSGLAGLPMLLLEEGHCLRDQAVEVCTVAGAGPVGDLAATSLPTLCQMVAAGHGATLLPASAVAVEARPGTGLVVRPLRSPGPSRTVVLAWRRGSPRAEHHRRLAAALRPLVEAACRAPQPGSQAAGPQDPVAAG
jgi:LysR family transcriptional regulator, hydrogen peroxide-inducible genes activator